MRGNRTISLSLSLGATAVVAATLAALPPPPNAQASTTGGPARSQRDALVAQLRSYAAPTDAAVGDLARVEEELASVQGQLLHERQQLAGTNTRLLALSRLITDDEHTIAVSKTELAALVRATYEATSSDAFTSAIFSSSDFNQAMDRIRGAQHVTDQVSQLQSRLRGREEALAQERAELQRSGATSQALEARLSDESNRLMALVASRDAVVGSLRGQARVVAQEIAQVDDRMAARAAGQSPTSPAPGGIGPSCGNHFSYGYCTYYVASRRCIPWFGNAWEWWGNARAYGFAEGHTPTRGAVVVFARGGYSPVGHVAYVEAVGPASGVPPGSFLLSEMNWNGGWGRVDQRVVSDGDGSIVGFIYGKQ